MPRIRRALISVYDKTGLLPFARALHQQKVEILSTGGTLKALEKARIPARSVSDLTGFPEILEGRVKTLHPRVHGGILYRRGVKSQEREISRHDIEPIDLVVVNLYPFSEVIQKKGVALETALENIDIGGPTMLRAAAKNFEAVVVVTDPQDYDLVLSEMKEGGDVSTEIRARLAQKVFERTSLYDHVISNYLRREEDRKEKAPLPTRLDVIYEKAQELRYGENPHQRGALYKRLGKPKHDFQCLHGKELSYNNFLDLEGTLDTLREFQKTAACVVKHTNPCGIAEGKHLAEAVEKAIEGDAVSAFGGIVGLNRPCDLASAKKIYELLKFLEIVVAPKFRPEAVRFLKERKNVRLVEVGPITEGGPWDLRFSKFGVLLQDRDRPLWFREQELRERLRTVTKAVPGKEDLEELWFAWRCVKTVRSNAIVITQNCQTVGIGAGQMSRVDSVEIACRKAGFRAEGGYLASDAFFPMSDSIELAKGAGIKAIIQPGGSIKDPEVIDACDRSGIAMVFTGERHFRH
jgi:phosphoribosylaminoimidazolecarboxamide formyltransferase/IMP cyclohydrolase